MSDTYTTTVERYGRTETVVDLPRFATDLAKALGGKVVADGEYPNENQAVAIGSDMLNLRTNTYAMKGRVAVYISAPDVPWGERNTYDKTHRPEDATINPNARSIERIAADIKRRVIDASQEALAKQRAYAAERKQQRSDIVRLAADLKTRVPTLDIRVNENERRAALYNGPGHYLSGTLNTDGTVSLERVGSMSFDKFCKVMAVLNEKNGGE